MTRTTTETTPAASIAGGLTTEACSDFDRAGSGAAPESLRAAGGHVDREYGPHGYTIALVYARSGHGVYRVDHFDGSRFYLAADKYGNVERVAD